MSGPQATETDPSLSLLSRLVDDAMDPGYVEAATRGDGGRVNWRHSAVLAAAIGVTAALVTAAVMQVQAGAPSAVQTRSELTDQVVRANALVESLDLQLSSLSRRAERLRQSALAGTSADRTLAGDAAALEAEVGMASVTGPGIEVTMADGPPAPAGDGGPDLARVLDTDVQLLVNGLFAAGATAVSVNGQRITALSPIRSAGEAVLVGFRPLTPPYVTSAVGDADLAGNFESGAARSELQQLEDAYGIEVDVTGSDTVTVPGRSDLQLRYAKEG